MTEQEAIEIINGIDEVRGNLPEDGNDIEIALMMAKSALKEIQQYRAIGTVEECRKAVEKQRAKKIESIGLFERCYCPNCLGKIRNKARCCSDCGQKLDWSEGE